MYYIWFCGYSVFYKNRAGVAKFLKVRATLDLCKMLTFEDISNDLLCMVFSRLNLSLVEPSAWKPLTLTVQLIKYVNSLNT
jgi:hypothetical protein